MIKDTTTLDDKLKSVQAEYKIGFQVENRDIEKHFAEYREAIKKIFADEIHDQLIEAAVEHDEVRDKCDVVHTHNIFEMMDELLGVESSRIK